MDKSEDKKAKKAALKKEAEKLGITYEEMKKRDKKRHKKSEAEALVSDEHKVEAKRMRAYSKDGDDVGEKRLRTRSMDRAEENEAVIKEEKSMSTEEWRKEHTLTLRGHGDNRDLSALPEAATKPYIEFTDSPYSQRIVRALTGAGFARPTPIQAQAWPLAVAGKDLISIAKTGSGKTCGFLLPVFHHHDLEQQKNGGGFRRGPGGPQTKPILLVLAPTRELSVQILEEAQKFGRPLGVRSVCCYGGAPKYPQIAALQRGVECIIACPGRLNDLIEMKKADLSSIKYLVLDEADRMLDMGFEPQIRSIVAKIPPEGRQTLLFSATWPKEIQRLAHDFLRNPVQINVGEVDALVANKDIKQTIIMCEEDDKLEKLETILKELTAQAEKGDGSGQQDQRTIAGGGKLHEKVIVFVARKISCHELANRLWDDGFAVDGLHGDRPQWERSKVMQAFKSGTLRMLIATDVAARGLDVKDVGVVVNYDMPAGVNAVEDYVHRIGRTGRAGAKGKAYTFFTNKDKKAATQLVEVLTKSDQEIPPALQAMADLAGEAVEVAVVMVTAMAVEEEAVVEAVAGDTCLVVADTAEDEAVDTAVEAVVGVDVVDLDVEAAEVATRQALVENRGVHDLGLALISIGKICSTGPLRSVHAQ
eukprot:CAMPEP_0113443864 /NCGR_PEP_ID=MMETSP0014_2-20120614/2369_1 /TAXON_ID=2857 /ORGANISM="Nitzschia sp." /LENGTH=646 /DNA_ID=CAMNT_0000334855 /DNA_START=110 /DNA_END=2051 /DNA_ORIENTATION=+ /assembly_acc=CAM_ASM_000159